MVVSVPSNLLRVLPLASQVKTSDIPRGRVRLVCRPRLSLAMLRLRAKPESLACAFGRR